MKKILITGGTGYIGRYLSELLLSKGYEVSVLTRGKSSLGRISRYHWNPEHNEIDENALIDVNYIIHLAGENIAERRWTSKRKSEIISSRIDGANLIFKEVSKKPTFLNSFISASATGFYGADTNEKIYSEIDEPSNDFLSQVCVKWENAAKQFSNKGFRTVCLRTGIVLSENGGALKKMAVPVRLGVGSAPGSGNQYLPWIHIEDLCHMYLKAIEDDSVEGVFNAVAPEHINVNYFYKIMAKMLKKPMWFPNIPGFIMKAIFGEMSTILLEGKRVSCEKIQQYGFEFKYPTIEIALENLLKKAK